MQRPGAVAQLRFAASAKRSFDGISQRTGHRPKWGRSRRGLGKFEKSWDWRQIIGRHKPYRNLQLSGPQSWALFDRRRCYRFSGCPQPGSCAGWNHHVAGPQDAGGYERRCGEGHRLCATAADSGIVCQHSIGEIVYRRAPAQRAPLHRLHPAYAEYHLRRRHRPREYRRTTRRRRFGIRQRKWLQRVYRRRKQWYQQLLCRHYRAVPHSVSVWRGRDSGVSGFGQPLFGDLRRRNGICKCGDAFRKQWVPRHCVLLRPELRYRSQRRY